MTINLTPDLEHALAEEARRQGTTLELLALGYMRERVLSASSPSSAENPPEFLAHFLAGHIGVLSSREHSPDGANRSEQSGRRFAAGLVKRREEGRL